MEVKELIESINKIPDGECVFFRSSQVPALKSLVRAVAEREREIATEIEKCIAQYKQPRTQILNIEANLLPKLRGETNASK